MTDLFFYRELAGMNLPYYAALCGITCYYNEQMIVGAFSHERDGQQYLALCLMTRGVVMPFVMHHKDAHKVFLQEMKAERLEDLIGMLVHAWYHEPGLYVQAISKSDKPAKTWSDKPGEQKSIIPCFDNTTVIAAKA